jgi:ribosome-binding factor A
MTNRMERVNSSIKRELSNIISRELTNTNITGLITVNKVDTAPDFSNSKVYVSMIAVKNKKEAMLALKKASGFMRTRLAHTLQFRKMPSLIFIYDESVEYGSRINEIIHDLHKDLKGKNDNNHNTDINEDEEE